MGVNPDELDLADQLAAEARAQRLVLFIGAGVSNDAGLPTWTVATKQAPPALHIVGREWKSLSRLDLRDQATVIEKSLGGPEKLQEDI